MRLVLRVLPLLSLLAAGCDRYQDDPVFAYGRVTSADGSPLPGATLTVERTPHNSYASPPFPSPTFHPYGTVTTEATGDFVLEAPQGDVAWFEGLKSREHRFRLTLPREDGGGTFLSFWFNDDVELPTVQPWEDHLALSTTPEGVTLTFALPPPAPEAPPTAELPNMSDVNGNLVSVPASRPRPVAQLLSQGQLLYARWDVPSPWTLSPYVLEDFASPELNLRAASLGEWWFFPLASIDSYLHFRLEWYTPAVALPAGTLRPVSRGASCKPSPKTECPWTDGQLEQVNLRTAVPEILFVLAGPTRLKHAVVRGVGDDNDLMRLEGSADGETWVRLGDLDLAASRLRLGPSTSADFYYNHFYTREGAYTDEDNPIHGPTQKYAGRAYAEAPLADVGPVRYVRLTSRKLLKSPPGDSLYFTSSLAELSLFE